MFRVACVTRRKRFKILKIVLWLVKQRIAGPWYLCMFQVCLSAVKTESFFPHPNNV